MSAVSQEFQKKINEQNKVNYFIQKIETNVQTVTFNRPERSNCFNTAMYLQLIQILVEAKNNKDVQVVVFKATGKNFCTGNDLQPIMDFAFDSVEHTEVWARRSAEIIEILTNTLIDFPKPIIGCVYGNCVGFMFTAMALFDMVLVTQDATFQAPMVKSSQNIEMCGSYTFPRLFGKGKSFELLVLGKILSAQDAVKYGYASRIYQTQELMYQDADNIAKELVSFTSNPIMQAKHLMRSSIKEDLKFINKKECSTLFKVWCYPDFKENLFNYLSGLRTQPKL